MWRRLRGEMPPRGDASVVEMTQLFTARDDRPWTVVPFIRGGALGVVFRGRAQIASAVVAFPLFLVSVLFRRKYIPLHRS